MALAVAGCSQGPARISAPNVDPEAAADCAIELYDSDHDGSLNKQELAACPAVLMYMSVYDQDGDGLVSHDEFVARLTSMYRKRVGLTEVTCQVTYEGRPLPDAEVVFDPEPYLGDEIPAANGKTDINGSAPMAISAELLPENLRQQHMNLSKVGTYKVRITHPRIPLPANYNADTTLGYETQLGNPYARFALTAK